MDVEENQLLDGQESFTGIPKALFVDNVDEFMAKDDNANNVNKVLRNLDEQHVKYKFMEYSIMAKKRKLQIQIPDLKRTLSIIKKLQAEKEEFETDFLLNDQLYVSAIIPPTDTVCLWLGANVMLEYNLEDAEELVKTNIESAHKNLEKAEHDIDFIRDQYTTLEVDIARVYNWDIKRRQAARST